MKDSATPITFAHRGAGRGPAENSIAGFRLALEAGVTGLETDVWCSADGVLLCSHDPTIRHGWRRTVIGRTQAVDLVALGLARFDEMYEQLGSDYQLSVDTRTLADAETLVTIARRYGTLWRLWICSPDLALLEQLRKEPEVRLVHSTRLRNIRPFDQHAQHLRAAGINAVNMHTRDWDADRVALAHIQGVMAFAWDCQTAEQLRRMLSIGIDGVYSDWPARMVTAVAQWAEFP